MAQSPYRTGPHEFNRDFGRDGPIRLLGCLQFRLFDLDHFRCHFVTGSLNHLVFGRAAAAALGEAERLRVLSFNVGLLDRWYPFTTIQVPFVAGSEPQQPSGCLQRLGNVVVYKSLVIDNQIKKPLPDSGLWPERRRIARLLDTGCPFDPGKNRPIQPARNNANYNQTRQKQQTGFQGHDVTTGSDPHLLDAACFRVTAASETASLTIPAVMVSGNNMGSP